MRWEGRFNTSHWPCGKSSVKPSVGQAKIIMINNNDIIDNIIISNTDNWLKHIY